MTSKSGLGPGKTRSQADLGPVYVAVLWQGFLDFLGFAALQTSPLPHLGEPDPPLGGCSLQIPRPLHRDQNSLGRQSAAAYARHQGVPGSGCALALGFTESGVYPRSGMYPGPECTGYSGHNGMPGSRVFSGLGCTQVPGISGSFTLLRGNISSFSAAPVPDLGSET